MQIMKLCSLLVTSLVVSSSLARDLPVSLRGLGEHDAVVVDQVFSKTRAALTPAEISFLEHILAADDMIMERQKRGIVDQILASISGVAGPSASNFILGGTPVQTLVAATPTPQVVVPPPNNLSVQSVQVPVSAAASSPSPQQPALVSGAGGAGNDNHLFNQISKVVINSATRNVTGIVDEALKIGTPQPVREFVNAIVGAAYCSGIRRLLGRC